MEENTNTPGPEEKKGLPENDLLSELSKATENKASKGEEKKEPKPSSTVEPTETQSNFWNMDDMEPEKPIVPVSPVDAKNNTIVEVKPTKLTEKALKHSAAVAVGMIELTQSGLMLPILKRKFKKKFTEAEYDRYEEIFGLPDSSLKDEDKQLIAKMKKAADKYEKLKAAIPFTKDEDEQLETAFYKYFEYKQIELPPGMHLAFACVNVVGKRIIDVVFD
jgi:hypothetical protein